VRDDKGVKTVVSGHFNIISRASAEIRAAKATEKKHNRQRWVVRSLVFYEVYFDPLKGCSG
jgi:hypothetical protein